MIVVTFKLFKCKVSKLPFEILTDMPAENFKKVILGSNIYPELGVPDFEIKDLFLHCLNNVYKDYLFLTEEHADFLVSKGLWERLGTKNHTYLIQNQ